jgi:hypothetical protein
MEEEKKSTYTPAAKKAIDKYRQKNAIKYNEKQREYYNEAKEDEEWRQKFNERCKVNNQKYRLKKKETLGDNVKPRGRPRKVMPTLNIDLIASVIQ